MHQKYPPHINKVVHPFHNSLDKDKAILFQILGALSTHPLQMGGATLYIESSSTSLTIKYDLFLLDPQFAPRDNNKIHHSLTSSTNFPKKPKNGFRSTFPPRKSINYAGSS
jgi:hypothetical protein